MSGSKVCPQCGTKYDGDQRFCPLDGATLVAEHRAESLAGSVLADRYLIREKLGEGGMGEVYLAEHVRMKRKVAVKVMRKWLTSDPASIGRFHREAENASQISHPNVAAVYDFGETSDGLVYLAMEFVAGESLTQVLEREGAINQIRASDIVSQIAEALAAAHSLGILHRDLKPDNVMVGKTRVGTDQVKLLDFGIARVMGRETQHFTSTGLIVGTPDWMSPEQISGDQLDARADIYALGLIGFRMLTGEGAFGSGTSQETLLAKMTKPPRRLPEVRPEVAWPDAVQATLDRAMAGSPGDRYGDALEFAKDFFYAISQMAMTPSAETYLAALSQRTVTPVSGIGSVETPARGVGMIEGTPVHGMTGLTGTGTQTPVGSTPALGIPIPAAARADTSAARAASEEVTVPIPVAALAGRAGQGAAIAADAQTASEAPTLEVEPGGMTGPDEMGEPVPPRPRGRRRLTVGVAVLGVLLLTTIAVWGRNRGTTQAVMGPPLSVFDSTASATATSAADSVRKDTSATAMPNTGSLDDAVRQSTASVFGIGTDGRGAGFLADSSGIVLTSASLVESQDTVPVLVDGAHLLLAPVLVRDKTRDVAALLISMKACGPCTPLVLADDSANVAVKDSVVAIGAPSMVSTRRDGRGTVSRVTDSRLTAALRATDGSAGGPLVLPNGLVAGLTRSATRSTATGIPAATIRAVLARAQDAGRRVSPVEREVASWSPTPVPNALLADGRKRSRKTIEDGFLTLKDDFAVLVMTPQVMAWRQETADSLKKNYNPMSLSSEWNCYERDKGRCDPIADWPAWSEYVAERRGVVIIQVAPKDAAPPEYGHPTQLLNLRRGSAGSFVITRDQTLLHPIDSARVHTVVNWEAYPRDQQDVYSRIFVFPLSDFASGGKVNITVTDMKNGDRRTDIELPGKLLDAVKADIRAIDSKR